MGVNWGQVATILIAILLAFLIRDYISARFGPAPPGDDLIELGEPPAPQNVNEWIALYKLQHPECQ